MSEIQLFFWGINAAIIFVVLFIVLIIALWVVNKWILKGKIRQLNRILISIGIPLMLIGWDYYSIYRSFYSSSNMDKLLDGIGAGITLPPYEITKFFKRTSRTFFVFFFQEQNMFCTFAPCLLQSWPYHYQHCKSRLGVMREWEKEWKQKQAT